MWMHAALDSGFLVDKVAGGKYGEVEDDAKQKQNKSKPATHAAITMLHASTSVAHVP